MLGLLAYHWLRAEDEGKAADYLLRAGDKARLEYALDEAIEHYRDLLPLLERRGERQEIALVLFKLALALHTSLRFAEANEAYQRAFALLDAARAARATERLRVATSFLPNDLDPKSAIAWPNIQACMQLFDRLVEAWPERTIVPSLAERWEISDDGLRYVFHLREGLAWSDGTPLTAHDVEFGIKRVLDPEEPRLVGGHLLRARERRGHVPRPQRRLGRGRRARARRPDGRVQAQRAGAVLHERHEPARRRAAAAPRDWRRRGRARRQRRVRGGRAERRPPCAAAALRAAGQRRARWSSTGRRSPTRCRSTSEARPT